MLASAVGWSDLVSLKSDGVDPTDLRLRGRGTRISSETAVWAVRSSCALGNRTSCGSVKVHAVTPVKSEVRAMRSTPGRSKITAPRTAGLFRTHIHVGIEPS